MALTLKKLVKPPVVAPGAKTLVKKPVSPLTSPGPKAAITPPKSKLQKDIETVERVGMEPKPEKAKRERRAKNPEDGKATKTVTVRMPDNHMDMLDELCQIAEADRSDIIKRAIRQLHGIYTSQSATLTLTDSDGEKSTQTLVRNGVPT